MPKNNFPKPKKYKTPTNSMPCIKYWDSEFNPTSLWLRWTILKESFEMLAQNYKKENGGSILKARKHIVGEFIAITCDIDQDSDCFPLYQDFLYGVTDYEFALWCSRLTIGTHVFEGLSRAKAEKKYKQWLKEDKNNPIYESYKVTQGLTVVPVKKR